MCGIVGSINHQDVVPELLKGLSNVEYRGYDSAGISVITDEGIKTLKRTGKLDQLRELLCTQPVAGLAGIGHTRWATHGEPNEANAHPHSNADVAVVHNGIIENHSELHSWLEAEGFRFYSQTDTEVIPHLISYYMAKGLDIDQAFNRALNKLEGAFALGVLFQQDHDHIYAARRGSPLVIGRSEQSMTLGSDAHALANSADELLYLEEGDYARLGIDQYALHDANGHRVERAFKRNQVNQHCTGKQNHRYYMHKEICEQPETISLTLQHIQDSLISFPVDFTTLQRVTIVACGTSYYAAMVAKYWFEQLAGLPVDIDIASEFRYRSPIMSSDGLAVFISQSGETADTLAALRFAKCQQQQTIAIVNVAESSIAREADYVLQTQAGPEIGVASTKAFTAQLTTLACLALRAATFRQQIPITDASRLNMSLSALPVLIREILQDEASYRRIGESISHCTDAYFIGRGNSFPIAMEGALKLKEISYIHAEGFGAGELKHGPIALIERDVPVFVIAPNDALLDKTRSNMEEVIARGGRCVLIGDRISRKNINEDQVECLVLPQSNDLISPLLYAVAIQLVAYHAALARGTDVDQPRNLAKSVTVE